MKKIFSLLFVSTIILTSCEGPEGPPGLDGLDGIIGETFERTINFNEANGYTDRIFLTPNIAESDVVLVYRLEGVDAGLDVWEPLPTVTIFLNDVNDTSVQYRFNFTLGDIDILMESNNPDLVPADLTNNQVFRIVIVPSDFAQSGKVDLKDLDAVKSALKLEF